MEQCPNCKTELKLLRDKCSIDIIEQSNVLIRTKCPVCDCFIQVSYSSMFICHAGVYTDDLNYKILI